MESLCGTCLVALFVLIIFYFYSGGGEKRRRIQKKLGKPDEPIEFALKNIRIMVPLKNILVENSKRKSNMNSQYLPMTPESPTAFPQVYPSKNQEEHKAAELEKLLKKTWEGEGFSFLSISELVNAYRTGKTTPLQVTENALEAIENSEKLDHEMKLRAFVQFNKADALLMAQESTKRYAEKKPLSIVDGIPVGLKEDYEVVGYHTRMGTTFVGEDPEEKDCNLVSKLRELGCVILGLTNMHELGLGTTGNNPNYLHGTPRNPYNLDYHTGGSSSGSACAVAAGICPVALGRDGGGSIRIPAAICGVVGIKATYGRISSHLHKPLGGSSVSHPGPICNNVRDTALMYALLSGRDVDYPPGLIQPKYATLEGFENCDLSDIKVGVDWKFSQFADQNVVESFEKAVEYLKKQAVEYLKKQGATIISIQIPELEEMRVAHIKIIGSEIGAGIENYFPEKAAKLNPQTVILHHLFTSYTAVDYLLSQRQRTRAIEFMKTIFSEVDCVLTPATACTVPNIPEGSHKYGVTEASVTGKLMRHSFLGNLTGVPGIVVPFGYDGNGLPISVQVMTAWWEEHVAFRVAHSLERGLVRMEPKVYYNILNPSNSISYN